jgi:Tfp pilus assembly PilM family ATPase
MTFIPYSLNEINYSFQVLQQNSSMMQVQIYFDQPGSISNFKYD